LIFDPEEHVFISDIIDYLLLIDYGLFFIIGYLFFVTLDSGTVIHYLLFII